MLTDEELENLPEDADASFIEYVRKCRNWLDRNINHNDLNYGAERKYVSAIRAYCKAYNINIDITFPPLEFNQDYLDRFDSEIEFLRQTKRIELAKSQKQVELNVCLSAEQKKQIHIYIDNIRDIVLPINLNESKKRAIINKINALSEEIDQEKTKTQAAMALSIEIASTVGQVAKELEPVKEIMNSITNLFGLAKNENDSLMISGSKPPKQIEYQTKKS
ncbi:MAG: hypothetical protein J0L77_07880 [Alphaproteobacteria bacterium]|nr:hypothetical protein [Alphaproteobacteria bacterium]